MNPRFIVHDKAGRTWEFESEARMVGFTALDVAKEYTTYYRDDYVAKLRAENDRLTAKCNRMCRSASIADIHGGRA